MNSPQPSLSTTGATQSPSRCGDDPRSAADPITRSPDRPIIRFSKLSLISLVLTCVLMPLVIIVVQFARVRLEMRDPIARAVGVPSIAAGVSAAEVIAVFLLLCAVSFLFSRRLLDRN
jgi:hypothetical protein